MIASAGQLEEQPDLKKQRICKERAFQEGDVAAWLRNSEDTAVTLY